MKIEIIKPYGLCPGTKNCVDKTLQIIKNTFNVKHPSQLIKLDLNTQIIKLNKLKKLAKMNKGEMEVCQILKNVKWNIWHKYSLSYAVPCCRHGQHAFSCPNIARANWTHTLMRLSNHKPLQEFPERMLLKSYATSPSLI